MIFDWDSKQTMFSACFEVKTARDGTVWLKIEGQDQEVVVPEGQIVRMEWQIPMYRFRGRP